MKETFTLFGIDYHSKDGDAVYIEAERQADGSLQIVREFRVPRPQSPPAQGNNT